MGNTNNNVKRILEHVCALIEKIDHAKLQEPDWDKSFLELGLTSVNLVDLVEEINQTFQCSVGSEVVFDYDTPFTLASFLAEKVEVLNKEGSKIENTSNHPSNIEMIVRKLLGTILEQEEEEISLENSFLEIGINSLKGVDFVEALSKQLDVSLGTEIIFDYFSPAELIGYLESICKQEEKIDENAMKEEKKCTQIDWDDIAVIGLAGRYADCNCVNEYWNHVVEGISSVQEIRRDGWNIEEFYSKTGGKGKSISKWAGLMKEIHGFAPDFFNISKEEATQMDPQQRVLLEEAYHACEDSGYTQAVLSGKNVGVFVGARGADYKEECIQTQEIGIHNFLGNDMSILAARISYFLNLKGPNLQMDASCASSLAAIHYACQSIRAGECDMALAGGVFVMPTPQFLIMNSQTGMLSPTGQCMTYSEEANGTVIGEGVGVAVLKPLKKALEDRDHIYGVIKGSAMNQNGRTGGLTVPTSVSQKVLIEQLYDKYNIAPETIDYLEVQGTGTALGDPIEFKALSDAYHLNHTSKKTCAIGCHKELVGHTVSAAGMAALTKVLMALEHKKLPAFSPVGSVNRNINIEQGPFYFNKTTKDWVKDGKRRAAINGYGFNGSNCHIILEEAPKIEEYSHARTHEMILLSAKTETSLLQKVKELRTYLEQKKHTYRLEDIAYTLCVGREHYAFRMAIRANSITDLLSKLDAVIQNREHNEVQKAYVKENAFTKQANLFADNLYFDEKQTTVKELEECVKQYLDGTPIEEYHFSKDVKKVSLPGYPFEHQICVNGSEEYKTQIKETQKKKTIMEKKQSPVMQMPRQNIQLSSWDEKEVVSLMKQIMQEMFSFEEEEIILEKPFLEYGMESSQAVEFLEEINQRLHIQVKPIILFDYESLIKLARYITEEYGGQPILYSEPAHKKKKVSRQVSENGNQEDIAIIGMAVKTPNANNVEEFWKIISEGKDCISEPSRERLDLECCYDTDPNNKHTTYTKRGGFCSDIDRFDAAFFHISGKEASLTDPQQRVMLEECYHALEDAGYAKVTPDGTSCGVYIGAIASDYYHVLQEQSVELDPYLSLGNYNSILASRISYFLNLKGPSIAVDTACSSAMVAIHLASQAIQNGDCEMALAGGVYFTVSPNFYIAMSNMNALSPQGTCRAFDQEADGFVVGEGAGALVLKKLSQAVKDGDHIYGILKGSNVNQDGKTNGITAPSVKSQELLLSDTYEKYQINPEQITYYEAHGTGTILGDPIEVEAITKAFRRYTNRKQYCALGSVKANIGHAIAAAGVISIIKLLLCMKYKKIPPQIHYKAINKQIDIENSPLYITTEQKDWEVVDGPRMGAVSSFGFSGTNAHVVIEEYNQQANEVETGQKELIILSAQNEQALRKNVSNLADYLKRSDVMVELQEVAYTLQTRRQHMNVRIAILVSSMEELQEKLQFYLEGKKDLALYLSDDGLQKEMCCELFQDEDGYAYIWQLLSNKRYNKLAKLWVSGVSVDFSEIYDTNMHSVSLPTYAFSHEKSYWVGKNVSQEQRKEQDIQQELVFYKTCWNEKLLETSSGSMTNYTCLIFADKSEKWMQLRSKLNGILVYQGDTYVWNETERTLQIKKDNKIHYETLLRMASEQENAIHIIYAWSYDEEYEETSFMEKVLYENYDEEYMKISTFPIFYLIHGIHNINYKGQFSISYLYHGTAEQTNPYHEMQMGISHSIALINPDYHFKTIGYIDCEPKEELLSEIGSEERNIVYVRGKRRILCLERR